jgi:hypothetical protein
MLIGIGVLLLLPQVAQRMEHQYLGFAADYEKVVVTIESDGRRTESRELYRLYHDTKGRTRMEGTTPSGQGEMMRFAFLTDRQKRRALVVDLATGKPLDLRGGRPPVGSAAAARPKPPGTPKVPDTRPEAQTTEDLGEAEIEGLAAHGWRTTSPSFGVSEVWQAKLIDQPPLLVKSRRPGEERTERLFNIRIGEPDPQLFAPLDAPQEKQ